MMQTLDQIAQRTRDRVIGVLDENLKELVAVAGSNKPVDVRMHEDGEKQLKASLFREMEAQKRVADLQAELRAMDEKFKGSQQKAIHEEHERHRLEVKALCEEFANKLERKAVEATLLQKQLEDVKTTAFRHPVDQGNAGEMEIEKYLRQCLQGFMDVKNVSKIGEGHEMDLNLISRDGTIQIRIDVKSGNRLLPEDEITRFHNDIDRTKPTGAILFMNTSLRCKVGEDPNLNVRKSRRANTFVFQIGCWSRPMLVESVHEIVMRHKLELQCAEASLKPFHGAPEVATAFKAFSNLVNYQNDKAEEAFSVIKHWRTVGGEMNRKVVEDLRVAHAANANAVTLETLNEFEEQIPTRLKGAHPKLPEEKKARARKRKTQDPLDPITKQNSTTSTSPSAVLERLRQTAAKIDKIEEGSAAKKPKVDGKPVSST